MPKWLRWRIPVGIVIALFVIWVVSTDIVLMVAQ